MSPLRDYQIEAAEYFASHKRALVKARAGSGKTWMAAAALKMVIEKRKRPEYPKIGWICSTTEQRDQGEEALRKFGVKGRVECAAANPDFSDMDCIVVDEAHHLPSPLWSGIVAPCRGAIWMMSATPFKEDDPEHNAAMMELCGGNVFEVCREKTKGNLAEARVIMLDESDDCGAIIDAEIDAQMKAKRWMTFKRPNWNPISEGELFARVASSVCMEFGIIGNQIRNQAIIRTAREHRNDSTLVLIHSIEHGMELAKHIPRAIPCSSKMGAKQRKFAIDEFKAGRIPCLIATSMLDEGADLPIANVLIMACGGRSSGRVEQRTGRVLRKFKGKDHGKVYDFKDNQHRVLRNQSLHRQSVYESLGYEFDKFRNMETSSPIDLPL